MKYSLLCLVFCLLLACNAIAQYTVEKHRSGGYSYESVSNDPYGVRKYVLKNGLTVFTSVRVDEPRIQTLISVRTGSKNDPEDATGLAHYLEHMLFKGTDRYGTLNYAKEKQCIDQIEELFEVYRGTKDSSARQAIYHRIDSISGVAATYAIPGEYDRMAKRMGARGTNAHTSEEETVYENEIPRNQFERWIKLEAERFRNPVLRLFHTELEAVYEEKNRAMDNDARLSNEALMSALFPKHQYGTHTTIGTIDHLKNPSMRAIRNYYNAYYVPNNMAIVLVGDIDPDRCVAQIDEAFSNFEAKDLPKVNVPTEEPIRSVISRDVFSSGSENLSMAYRFDGAGSKDVNLVIMCDMLLSNSTTGLIDLNIGQKQLALSAGCSPQLMKDFTIHRFFGTPRRGQKLEEVRDLILAQIEELKQGRFSEASMKAVLTNMRISFTKQMEAASDRANVISRAYIYNEAWSNIVAHLDDLSRISKQEVVDFAKSHYTSNYVIVYKRQGEKKSDRVVKPAITPIKLNTTAESEFSKSLLEEKVEKIEPKFSDFTKDLSRVKLKNGAELIYVQNKENQLYNLNFVWDYGTKHDTRFSTAMQYLDFVGAGEYSASELKTKLYGLGCTIKVSAGSESMTVELSGSADNLTEALKLVDLRMQKPVADTAALKLLVDGILKQRINVKKNKNVILRQALLNFAMYGKRNPFTTILSEQGLRDLKAEDVLETIRQLSSLKHKILYYGPQTLTDIQQVVEANHTMASELKELPEPKAFEVQANPQGKVYFLDFDMIQAEVIMRMSIDGEYSPDNSSFVRLYNEYNGGLSGVVFQTIRESKALAYSVEAGFMSPRRLKEPYFLHAYVGTQADKLPETLVAMHDVLQNTPRNESAFANAKQSVLEKIEAERFRKMDLIDQYENLRRLGLDYDVRSVVYKNVPKVSFDDLLRMRDEKTKEKKFTIIVLGSASRVKKEDLAKYGEVQYLSLEDVFGY